MPYPKDGPKCKHKLISHQGLSVSRLEPKMKPIEFVKMAKSNKISKFNKHIANIYTYEEAPNDPEPLGSFHLYGFCDSSSLQVSSSFQGDPSMEGTKTCRIGVKDASGKYKLDKASIQNSNNFAVLIRQLRREDRSVFFACTKTQKGGFIIPMEDDGSHDVSLDFCAYFFVASLDDLCSILGKGHEENEQTFSSSIDAGSLWTPGDAQSTGMEEESWTLHDPMKQEQYDTIEDMNRGINMEKNQQNSMFHTDKGAAAADAFYSSLKRSLNTRADSILYHMRNYNGWVKATQIAELNPYTINRSSLNNKTNDKKRKRESKPLRVLDLACGKGGDLGKWVLHKRRISNYVGIDVARGSLVDAALRARGMKELERCGCIFTCADLGSDVPGRPKSRKSKKMQKLSSWSLRDDNGVGDPEFRMVRGGGIGIEDTFDVVSIQFAIHYMMSSLKRARRFFHTVSQLLDIGGNLICTTIDSRVVMELMMDTGYDFHFDDAKGDEDGEDLIISVGKGACQLKFRREIVKRIFLSSLTHSGEDRNYLHPDNYGLEYTFTLTEGENHESGVGQAVDLPEWLTPIPVLEKLAEEAGLVLEYASNFHEFFDLRKDPIKHYAAHSSLYVMNVLNRSGSISEQEWDISRMYVAIKFRKEREPSFAPSDSDDDGSDQDSVGVDMVDSSNQILKDESMKDRLLRAMMIAKQKCGDDWEKLSSEERNTKMNEELSKLSSS